MVITIKNVANLEAKHSTVTGKCNVVVKLRNLFIRVLCNELPLESQVCATAKLSQGLCKKRSLLVCAICSLSYDAVMALGEK
jgi:hypothetical protein